MSGAGEKQPHHNNIGVLRLLFALMVLVSHSYVIARGSNEPEPFHSLSNHQTTMGGIAVDGFFLLSGYLVVKSWVASSSAIDFVRKRLTRIYPGYLVALFVSAVIAAAHASSGPLNYARILFYRNEAVLKAALFVQTPQDFLICNTFVANPMPLIVNGSLWTLQPELECYALVMAVGCFGLILQPRVLATLLALVWIGFALNLFRLNPGPAGVAGFVLWRFLLFFGSGAMFYLAHCAYCPGLSTAAGAFGPRHCRRRHLFTVAATGYAVRRGLSALFSGVRQIHGPVDFHHTRGSFLRHLHLRFPDPAGLCRTLGGP